MSEKGLAKAFAITHPAVTSALIGPRTMNHFDELLAGTDIGTLDQTYMPPDTRRAGSPLAARSARARTGRV